MRDSAHLQDDYNRDLIASVLQEKGRKASSKDYDAMKKALEGGASYQYLKAMVDALPITSNLMGM